MNIARNLLCQKIFNGLKAAASSAAVTVKPGILGVHCAFEYQPCRNAGHSKWANIKHTKMAKDMEKSKELTRFGSMIKIAVKEGGSPDPKTNSKLAQVLSQIKTSKLPMSSFEKLLQNLQAKKENKVQVLPVKGPGNCILLVELSSDNLNRTRQEINTILRKNKGLVIEDSAFHLFEHKGIIYSNGMEGKPASEENLEDTITHAIEAGADDVIYLPDHPEFGEVYEFSTAPSAFFKVKHTLENLKYEIVHGDVDYIPLKEVELDNTEIEDVQKLYQKLSDYPDVAKISANIA